MKIMVTGASGFVASHIVQTLLAGGHQVLGTVRDPDRAASVAHLRALSGAAERLELAAADLNDGASFKPLAAQVEAVLHTASPYVISVPDPQRDLVDPAVNGVRAVLDACAAAPGVRRVVMTSSMAAVTDEPDGRVLTEADWNTKSTLRRNPYYFSKAEAERAAWRFMETRQPGFDLVAINPYMVIGPAMTAALNPSNQLLSDLVKGVYPALMRLTFGLVDVRDVAEAHVRALTRPAAHGRYICAAGTRTLSEIVEILRRLGIENAKLPRLRLDNRFGDVVATLSSYGQPAGVGSFIRTHIGRTVRFDTAKIRRDLGLSFRDIDASIVETVADLRRWGHI